MSAATRILHSQQPFTFARGGQLPALELAYECWGELNAARSNAILIFTGLSPDAHAASSPENPEPGWWEFMLGPGKPLDSERFFVICVNSLGSCKGSTGPASLDPATGQPYRLRFPELSLEDIAAATQRVVSALGIEQLFAVVGPSMGGMTTLAWLQQNPAGARHMISISSAAHAEPFSIAIRSLQREMIVSDPAWQDGAYSDAQWPEHGMRMARKLGMISYRSAGEWRERFGRAPQAHYAPRLFGMNFAVESYLEAAAERFIGAFDPCCYLYLSRAMDRFDAAAGQASLSTALAPVRLESALVLGVDSDVLFPAHQQQEIHHALRTQGVNSQLQVLSSVQGHDAFLVDSETFAHAVSDYLQNLTPQELPQK